MLFHGLYAIGWFVIVGSNVMIKNNYSKYINIIKKAVSSTFNEGDWKEFGHETDKIDIINSGRLLRSLSWNDTDYDGHIYTALDQIIRNNSDNFNILIQKDKIKTYIKSHDLKTYNEIYDATTFIPSFKPEKLSLKEVANKALANADDLIKAGEPESAVDRVHTVLHDYLRAVCDSYNIEYASGDAITRLYKRLREDVIFTGSGISQSDDIKKILSSLAACVDSLNTLRNHASLAHANDRLLGIPEATLAINTTRTVLHYIEARIHL